MDNIYKKISGGHISWYKEETDVRHREDGPAIEWNNGTKHWYQNGELHRVDGPAVEYWNGDKEYWLYDKRYPNIKADEEWIIFQIIN